MADETAIGSPGAPDGERSAPGGGGFSSPFQARAQFFKNWSWESVVSINRGACERGRAQHGVNSETQEACSAKWKGHRCQSLTLAAALDQLRGLHKAAPFLYFNRNTFARIDRELAVAILSELAPGRKREASSAIAHYIAGVLDWKPMVEIVEGLCQAASFQAGDRVKTPRGSTHGRVLKLLKDRRLLWQRDGSASELTALPEILVRE